MNNIKEVQNSKKILMLLYSQRKHYNKAELYSLLSWITIIAISLVGQINSEVAVIVAFALMILNVIFSDKIGYYVKVGSSTKSYVDNLLFGFSNDFTIDDMDINEIEEIANIVSVKYKKEYEKQITHNGCDKYRGVKDWYTNVTDDLKMKEAIYECQKENLWWDENLCKIYKKIIIFIVVICFIVFLFLFKDITVKEFIVKLLTFSTLVLKIYNEYREYKRYQNIVIGTKAILKCIDKDNIEDLKKLQKNINRRRRTKFLTPNFIHNIKSKSYHDLRKAISNN